MNGDLQTFSSNTAGKGILRSDITKKSFERKSKIVSDYRKTAAVENTIT